MSNQWDLSTGMCRAAPPSAAARMRVLLVCNVAQNFSLSKSHLKFPTIGADLSTAKVERLKSVSGKTI
ncbi:hypothetical protein [Rhizobium leguminosarum]